MEYLPHMPNSSKLHTDMDALQYEHLAEHTYVFIACIWFTDYNRSARAYLFFHKTELDIQRIEVPLVTIRMWDSNVAVRFSNHLTLYVTRILPFFTGQTDDGQIEKTSCLTPLCTCAHRVIDFL